MMEILTIKKIWGIMKQMLLNSLEVVQLIHPQIWDHCQLHKCFKIYILIFKDLKSMEPKVEIEQSNLSKTYNPGDFVSGRVIIISNGDEATLSEVILRLEGMRTVASSNNKLDEHFFCEKEAVLLHGQTSLPADDVIDLPFQFQLPFQIPSSFHIGRGHVHYRLIAIIRRPSEFDLIYKSSFYVTGVLELDANNCSFVETHKSKAVGSCSCFNLRKSQRFGLALKLEKNQFVPADHINYTIKIWNSSKIRLEDAEISIVRETSFYDSGNFKIKLKLVEVLHKIEGPIINSGEKLYWTSVELEPPENNNNSHCCIVKKPPLLVPPLCPITNLGAPKVISLNYFVKVSIKATGLCPPSPLESKCSILIGSCIL